MEKRLSAAKHFTIKEEWKAGKGRKEWKNGKVEGREGWKKPHFRPLYKKAQNPETEARNMNKMLGFLFLLIAISFCACGSSVQHGLVLWVEGDQVLFDIGSDSGLKTQDKVSIYREIKLVHPASGEDLSIIEEEVADASVTAVRKNTATAEIDKPIKVQPGDKVVVTKRRGRKETDFIKGIGSVIYAEPKSQLIEINFTEQNEIFPGATLTVAMPLKVIQPLTAGDKIAVEMMKLADVEVVKINTNSNTAQCRITESNGYPEIGDAIVKLSDPLLSYWFQEISRSSEELIYQRTYRQAIRYYESAEYWNAIKSLQTVQDSNPDYEDTLYLLAVCYKRLGIYLKASDYFDKAIRKNPDDTKIWLELAYMYLDQNLLNEAANIYQRLTELIPNNFQLWLDLGDIYRKMGDEAKSHAAYQKAAEIEPDNEEVKYQLQLMSDE